MKIIRLLGCATTLLSLALPASADEPQPFQGVMTSKCGKLIDSLPAGVSPSKNALAFGMLSWTEGYISGLNLAASTNEEAVFDQSSITREELWAEILSYCAQNPDEVAVKAAINATSVLKLVKR